MWLAPELPEAFGRLRVERIPLAGGRVSIEVDDGSTKIEGLAPEVEVISVPRDPMTAV